MHFHDTAFCFFFFCPGIDSLIYQITFETDPGLDLTKDHLLGSQQKKCWQVKEEAMAVAIAEPALCSLFEYPR